MNLGDMRVTNGAQRGEGGVTPGHIPVEPPMDITRHSKDYSEEYCRLKHVRSARATVLKSWNMYK